VPLYPALTDRTFYAAAGRWRLVGCLACGSAYLDPRPTPESIGRAYSTYFTHGEAPGAEPTTSGLRLALANGVLAGRWGYDVRPRLGAGRLVAGLAPPRAALVARDVRHLPARAGGRLLDVGCGSGAFLARMKALGWEAEGVEPDEQAVAVARAAGPRVTQGTVFDLPADARFDAVTLSHVIEHLHDPGLTLRRIHSLLEPGGTLWIATPNLRALGHRRFAANWLHLDPPRHLVLFTPDSLDALLRRCGFVPAGSPPHAPAAWPSMVQSAAIRDGRRPWEGPRRGRRGLRLLALLADLLASRSPALGEELVVVARRTADQPSST
jgi:SAM-dependent methyltransferase